MAKKQTRRSVSLRGDTYQLLREYSQEHKQPMSDVVEGLLAELFLANEEIDLRPDRRENGANKPVPSPRPGPTPADKKINKAADPITRVLGNSRSGQAF